MKLRKSEKDALFRLKEYIDLHLDQKITITELSSISGMNRIKVQAGFFKLFSVTIHAYQLQLRMKQAADLLAQNEMIVKEIAAQVGYSNCSKFTPMFKKHFGITPTDYRLRHAG